MGERERDVPGSIAQRNQGDTFGRPTGEEERTGVDEPNGLLHGETRLGLREDTDV